jgi:acyl carrier protein
MYAIGGSIMEIGSATPPQCLTPNKEWFSINDVRTLVAKQLRVDVEFVTSETHFTNDLGADLLDRVELMLAIEDKFAGVQITDDDVERIQVVGDLIRHLNVRTTGYIAVSQAGVRTELRKRTGVVSVVMFGGRNPNIDRWAMTAGRYEGAKAE